MALSRCNNILEWQCFWRPLGISVQVEKNNSQVRGSRSVGTGNPPIGFRVTRDDTTVRKWSAKGGSNPGTESSASVSGRYYCYAQHFPVERLWGEKLVTFLYCHSSKVSTHVAHTDQCSILAQLDYRRGLVKDQIIRGSVTKIPWMGLGRGVSFPSGQTHRWTLLVVARLGLASIWGVGILLSRWLARVSISWSSSRLTVRLGITSWSNCILTRRMLWGITCY